MKKKIISTLFAVFIVSIFLLTQIVVAYGPYDISYDFNSGFMGRAYLAGADNGKFYHLTPGRVHLDATNNAGTGKLNITLYRKNSFIGWGQSYGTKSWYTSPDQSTTMVWYVDANDSNYFLYLKGSGNYIQYTGSGKLYDW